MSSNAPLLRPPRPGLMALFVALAAGGVFAGSLANGFVYDDQVLVVENPWLRSTQGLRAAFSSPLFGFVDDGSEPDVGATYYRPLAHATYFLLRAVFGMAPWGFHLFLVVAHVLASLLVLRLLRGCLSREPEQDAASEWAVLGGALLFALHPIHTEAVAWVSGWMDLGVTLALLATVVLLVPRRVSSGRAALAALAWLAALLLKETAIVLPLLLWPARAVVGTREEAGKGRARAWLGRYAPLGLALAVYAALRLAALGLALPTAADRAGHDGPRVPNALGLLAELGGRLVWPHPLVALPPSDPVRSAAEPRVWLGGLGVALLVTVGVAAARRGQRTLLMALVWMVVPLLPVLVLPLRGVEGYAERYLYLPSVGFVLAVAVGLRQVLARWPERARTVLLASGGVLALAAALVGVQVPVWRTDVSLWEDAVLRVPDRPRAHAWLGAAYLKERRVEEARQQLELAVAALPGEYRVRSDLAVAYALTGALEPAIRELEAAIRLRPFIATPRHNLGLALRRAKRLDAAAEQFQEAVRLEPRRADSHLELGRTLLQLGRPAEAVPSLEEALRLNPAQESARRALDSARAALAAP